MKEPRGQRNSIWRFVFPETDLKKAWLEAEAALKSAGFSVARRHDGASSAIVFGDFDVARRSDLDGTDRKGLQGSLHGDVYPVVAFFPSGLSEEADEALMAMNAAMARRCHMDETSSS